MDGGGVGVVLMLLLVPLVLVAAWWLQKKRHEHLEAWARSAGWEYVRTDPGYGLTTLQRNQPFEQGHSRRATEVLTGRWQGLPAVSYTYEWATGSGKEKKSYSAHVVALALPAYLPVLELTSEGLGARIAKALGARDMQTESVAFNDAYRVVAGDQRVGHAILHPRLMERLLHDDARATDWRIEGMWIASWRSGRTDTSDIAGRLGVLHAVVQGVPRHVWQDHGYDPLAAAGGAAPNG